MFFKSKNKKENEISDSNTVETNTTIDTGEETVLYVLSERNIHGLKNYAAEHGLDIEQCFTDVEEAKIAMLIESRPTRMIIIESGLGKFISTGARKDIIDLIGICDGGEKKVSVFYTNSLLKGDTLKTTGKKGKELLWFNYRSTLDVIKDTLELKEKYVKQNVVDVDIETEKIMAYQGREVYIEKPLEVKVTNNILEEMKLAEQGESLPKFNVTV